jgi:hypothetical protein
MEKSQQIAKKYCCKPCDYSSCNKADYKKHLSTQKHKYQNAAMNYDVNVAEKSQKSQDVFQCENCNKEYKDYSGLWRHKKKCSLDKSPDDKSSQIDTNIVFQLIKQNDDFKNLIIDQTKIIMEQNKTIVDAIKQNNSITNNINQVNSNNNTFNLNLFLHEHCKDAMNINEFLDSINFQLSDLEHMGRVGYVEGIAKLIITNLNALDVTKRPLHCTDPKRETIYIKEGDVWITPLKI